MLERMGSKFSGTLPSPLFHIEDPRFSQGGLKPCHVKADFIGHLISFDVNFLRLSTPGFYS